MKTPRCTLYALLLLPILAQAGETPADAAKAAAQSAAPDATGQRASGGIIPPVPMREATPGEAPRAAGGGMPPQPIGDTPLGAPATEQTGQ